MQQFKAGPPVGAWMWFVVVGIAACSPAPREDNGKGNVKVDAAAGDTTDVSTADIAVLDTGSSSDAATADTLSVDAPDSGNTACGQAGCACTGNGDCDTGVCIENAGKRECASLCASGGCPDGFKCTQLSNSASDIVSVCTPMFNRLCAPCQADSDCSSVLGGEGNRCVPYKDGGGSLLGQFCAAPCGAGDSCPSGYSCQEASSVGGLSGKQCVKSDLTCSCDARSIELGLATPCNQVNGLGTCGGKRTCSASGLSACDAASAQTETCNLKDDNCNGQTDEPGPTVCPDGAFCTYDNCLQGECQHLAKTGPCDDGDACTKGDLCSDGLCKASAITCDDGDVCTEDGCDKAKGCVILATAVTCTDGNACTTGDACKDGGCLPSGATVCDDGNGCTSDACDPAKGCVFSANAAPCDDGDACTLGDTCSSGSCVGQQKLACADGNPCTDDACDLASGCTFTDNSAACSDGNPCTAGDLCSGGKCAAGKVVLCDDQNPCTDDACDLAGNCTATANSATCSDGSVCTTGDVCANGACAAGALIACSDGNPCTDDACDDAKGCVFPTNIAPCDDGNSCTEGDACKDGACTSGAPLNCDDGNSCTNDFCTAGDGCLHKDNTASCSDGSVCSGGDVCDGGACKAGALLPCQDGNPCTDDGCDANKGCTFTPNSAPCDDFNGCTSGDTCQNGQCKPGEGCGANAVCAPTKTSVACVCSPGYIGDGKLCVGGCGDGVKSELEGCDDGNLSGGDGCSVSCTVEQGWSCGGAGQSTCCAPGQYFSGGGCLPCQAGCASCNGPDACTSCPLGQFLQDGKCVLGCAVGQYAADGTCKACPAGCVACASATACSLCAQGKVLAGGLCLNSCPDGTFNSSGQCAACDPTCATCSDAKTCSSCPPGKALVDGKCGDCAPKVCGTSCGQIDDGCGGTVDCGPCVASDIAAGNDFTCGLLTNGQVRCWGSNAFGQLGDGTLVSRLQPTAVDGNQSYVLDITTATQVAVGQDHACALLADKTVRCWGSHAYGQLGDGSAVSGTARTKPVAVLGLTNAVAIAAGRLHTCALLGDGTAKCWGQNGSGQLGDGTVIQRTTPVAVSGLTGASQITGGYAHTCALLSNGVVKCWGWNSVGQVGDNTLTNRTVPTTTMGIVNAKLLTTVALGSHTCIAEAAGGVKCWGYNAFGQIGDNTILDKKVATVVSGLTTVSALSNGAHHSCALLADSTMRCWGRNSFGQLGDTTLSQRNVPVAVQGLSGAAHISAGAQHTCALVANDGLRCWGSNAEGQVGVETTLSTPYVTTVPGYPCGGTGTSESCKNCKPATCQSLGATSGVVADGCGGTLQCGVAQPKVAIGGAGSGGGGFGFTCAVHPDTTVRCWGRNEWGQLGDGTTRMRLQPTRVNGDPAPVVKLQGAVAVATGRTSACAVRGDGTVWCWGSNQYGQLGNGGVDAIPHPEPVQVAGLTNAVSISAGNAFACALLADGTAKCWGFNAQGQLGDGTTTQRSQPVAVQGLSGLVAIYNGLQHSCALTQTGLVRCWGVNTYGNLGNGDVNSTLPRNVASLDKVISLGTGPNSSHSCAIRSDGTGRCWGYNVESQLGDLTLTDRLLPVTVQALSGAQQVSVGSTHSCARLQNGTVQCWGGNDEGAIGDGTLTLRKSPTTVTNLDQVEELVAGPYTNCARRKDGTLRCWGWNALGQIGNETTLNSALATPVAHWPCGGGGSTDACKACQPTTCQAAGVDIGSIPDGCGGTLWCGSAPSKASGGSGFGCMVVADGSVRCWGRNHLGQLGNGGTTDTSKAVAVLNLTGVVSVSAGQQHACALRTNGTVWCWGGNANGQLGVGSTDTAPHGTPTEVSGLTQVARISAGRLHTCAQLTDGSAKCWGYNAQGQLGDGTVQQRTSPVTVLDVSNFVELNGGYTFTCGLTQTGRVKCWGDNTEGQLGNGNSNWTVPMNVAGLSGVGGLMQASMALHQCAVLTTGGGRCWGDNGEGQLGDNSSTNRNYQVVVSGLAAAASMSGGAYHSCALLQDGTGRCWGRNLEGQLGDTTFVAKRLTPVTVAKVTAATAVAAQAYATCWPAKDGTVQCSGLNSTGGLGDGSLVNKSTVVPLQGL